MRYFGKQSISSILYLSILAFFTFYLVSLDWDSLKNVSVNYGLLFIASILSLAFRFWGVFIWKTVLRSLGVLKLPPATTLCNIYAKSWLGRYMPGSVGWIGGKIFFASSHGISKKKLAISTLLEAGTQIVALFSVSVILILASGHAEVISTEVKIIFLVSSVLALSLLNPAVFNRITNKIYSAIKRESADGELDINGEAIIKSFAMYAFGGLVSGAAFFLMSKSLLPDISLSLLPYFIGSFNLTGAIGMCIPLLPSGIGVREGLLVALLAPVVSLDYAIVLSVTSRLWSAGVDILFYFISATLDRLSSKP